jgi:hypothetical protein
MCELPVIGMCTFLASAHPEIASEVGETILLFTLNDSQRGRA